jgi:hypothetical protein
MYGTTGTAGGICGWQLLIKMARKAISRELRIHRVVSGMLENEFKK